MGMVGVENQTSAGTLEILDPPQSLKTKAQTVKGSKAQDLGGGYWGAAAAPTTAWRENENAGKAQLFLHTHPKLGVPWTQAGPAKEAYLGPRVSVAPRPWCSFLGS